jgi:hypothetical protein
VRLPAVSRGQRLRQREGYAADVVEGEPSGDQVGKHHVLGAEARGEHCRPVGRGHRPEVLQGLPGAAHRRRNSGSGRSTDAW